MLPYIYHMTIYPKNQYQFTIPRIIPRFNSIDKVREALYGLSLDDQQHADIMAYNEYNPFPYTKTFNWWGSSIALPPVAEFAIYIRTYKKAMYIDDDKEEEEQNANQ